MGLHECIAGDTSVFCVYGGRGLMIVNAFCV